MNGVMMVMVVMMRRWSSRSRLLWSTGVRRVAERMEGSRGVGHLLLWQAVMMVVMARRKSCQHQRGYQERVTEHSLMGMGMGMMMVMMRLCMCRLWSLTTPLAGSRSVSTIDTVAVLSGIFSQSASCLSAVGFVVGIGLPSWTAA